MTTPAASRRGVAATRLRRWCGAGAFGVACGLALHRAAVAVQAVAFQDALAGHPDHALAGNVAVASQLVFAVATAARLRALATDARWRRWSGRAWWCAAVLLVLSVAAVVPRGWFAYPVGTVGGLALLGAVLPSLIERLAAMLARDRREG